MNPTQASMEGYIGIGTENRENPFPWPNFIQIFL